MDTPIKKAPRPIIGALREPLDKLPQVENFQLVGHTIITNPGETIERGRNGSISLAPPCGYVGNRLGRRSGTGPAFGKPVMPPEIAIVDISNPNKPTVIGHLVTPAGGTTRELRAFPELNTLYVMNFAADTGVTGAAVNNFMIYDITDCRRPVLKQTIGFGSATPHEFFVWRDRKTTNRVLVYFSWSSAEPWLRVYDVTNATSGQVPTLVATFTMNPVLPASQPINPAEWDPAQFRFNPPPTSQTNTIHSMSTNEEGTRVYIAGRHSGFYVLDSTHLANGTACIKDNVTTDASTNLNPDLCLRKVNPDPYARVDWHPPTRGTTHSVNKLPGRPYVLASDERNGTTTCPWAWGWVIDVTNEASPQVLAPWMLPENLSVNCFEGGPGDPVLMREFSTHQILQLPNLFFQSWYSAGLRAWDVSNPWLPSEVGVYVPKPEYPNVVEPFRNSPDVWTWSYPVLYNGLIHVMDENTGLLVLKYTGRRADEVPQEGILEGNAVH